MAEQADQSKFDLTKFFLLSILLMLEGCSLFLKTSDTDMKNSHYAVTVPSGPWMETEKDTADYAWIRDETGTNLVANSYCKKYQTTGLDSLTLHLFHGIDDVKVLEQKAMQTHGRDGLQTEAQGSMDGVPIHLFTRVFNRDNCTYDLTLIRTKSFDDIDRRAFEQVLQSYHFNSE